MVLILATNAVRAEESKIHSGVTIALPQNCTVKIRWVCPPLDEKTVEESGSYDVVFSVDDAGRPWLGHNNRVLLSPTKQYAFTMDQSVYGPVCMDNGAMILSSQTHIGFPVPPKEKHVDYRGLPEAAFQPIAAMPFPGCKLFPGASSCLYLVGHNPKTNTAEVYLLRPEKGGIRQFTRMFASKEPIAAATGDGDNTYIAMDRLVLKVLSSGAVSKVFVHPTQAIEALAYDPRIGIFYATETGVGFIGANGSVDLLAASKPRICLQKGSLYVFLPKNYGVLALDNVRDLKRFSLAFKDVPAAESSEAKVAGIRFFEAGDEMPASEDQRYAGKFKRATTRRVYCRIDLDNLLRGKRGHQQTVGLEVSLPWRTDSLPTTWVVDFPQDVPSVLTSASVGSDAPGTLYPGEYVVKVYLNGAKADERKLVIDGDATVLEAASCGDTERLRALLAKGADANEVGADGVTPLFAAATDRSLEDVKLLLAHGANVNAQNADGETALKRISWGDDGGLQIVKLLLAGGADPNIPDNDGKTSLHEAVSVSSTEIIRSLLEHKADPNAKDSAGTTPLQNVTFRVDMWTRQAKPEAIELLLKHGANPNLPFVSGPFYNGNVEAARLFIKYKANVNAVEKRAYGLPDAGLLGQTISHYEWELDPGIRDGMREIIRLLSAEGARLLPGEESMAFENGVDSLLDRRLIKSYLEKDDQLVSRYLPEDPELRALVLDRLMRIAFSTIATSNSKDGFSQALNMCLDARTKADMWGMLAKHPEISFNCGLLWTRTGNPSNARLYLEEYLRLAPNGSEASKAKELLGR